MVRYMTRSEVRSKIIEILEKSIYNKNSEMMENYGLAEDIIEGIMDMGVNFPSNCKDCGIIVYTGSARCNECWNDRCEHG